ncbi:protoporphyrinogen oxidase [Waddlia chondrophila 2032/99]|uniref:Coproporphyrinogen III oxidase n=1 Tax=Waddlia chondrophila 2032/99 TaxID=765953 RepID=F8LC23_9BACT|nr:protoporphyrinogen oxidase [Waddlia chondrophila]CCB91037.1 protoporphyrinogen oxidase [Waddlia chondrophila 2032/99]
MKHFVILGAGISGLSLGWFLKRRYGSKIQLTILEQSDRPGGLIRTDFVEGSLFEQGPRSLRTRGNGLETLKLIEKLQLQSQVIAANPKAKKRYLWTGGKLRKLPTGPLSFLTSPLTRTLPWVMLREMFRKKSVLPDESIASFITRRFGSRVSEKLFDPLTTGIFAGDINKLSIRSCFPDFYQWEKQYGSVCKGMVRRRRCAKRAGTPFLEHYSRVPLFSFKEGMETLPCALAEVLAPHLRCNTAVVSLRSCADRLEIGLADGNTLTADHVFSTLPAAKLAPLFENRHRELSTLLMSISGSSVAVVQLAYFRKVLRKEGFGYLVPSSERESILGCVFDSSVFPQQNQIPEETRLTVMIGGMRAPDLVNQSEKHLKSLAVKSLESHLGIGTEPDTASVKIVRSAIPQYFVGHMEKVERIGTILARIYPRMTLAGNHFSGVSVNDCIANSKRIVERMAKFFSV